MHKNYVSILFSPVHRIDHTKVVRGKHHFIVPGILKENEWSKQCLRSERLLNGTIPGIVTWQEGGAGGERGLKRLFPANC